MKTIIKNITLFAIILAGLLSCSNNVLDENPPHILSGETLYTNLAGFEAGLNGLYNIARHHRWQSEKIEHSLNGTDNMSSNYRRGNIYYRWEDTNSPANSILLEIFSFWYEVINAANTIIERAENPDVNWSGGGDTPANNKMRVIAEAHALRGWAYRFLTSDWGDVPLALEEYTGSTIKTDWERAPRLQVRRQAIEDFKFAQQYIPTEASLQGRITKGAVQTYLSEMYLTINKPDSALYWANQAINNPAYKLVTKKYGVAANNPDINAFGSMFKEGNQNREEGNTEALWVWQFTLNSIDERGNEMSRAVVGNYNQININGVRALQYTYERGGRGKAYFGLTKWAIDIYEDKDERGTNDILRRYFILRDAQYNAPYPADRLPSGYKYGDTIWCHWDKPITEKNSSRADWPYPRKGEGTDPENMSADFSWSDIVYLRLADTYLLKAEAEYKLGNAQAAANTINILRERANSSPVSAKDINIDFILDERSRELVGEEDRRITLIRTHKWYERVKKYNLYGGEKVAQRDTLFPIPQAVIDANLTKTMPQNPGWN